MARKDAGSIALKGIRSILAAAHSTKLNIAGTDVDVAATVMAEPDWPGDVDGLDPSEDGPWPKPISLECTWEEGSAALRMDASIYKDKISLSVATDKTQQLLCWSSISAWVIDASDGDTALFGIGTTVAKRKKGPKDQTNKILTKKLRELLGEAGLEKIDNGKAVAGHIQVPDGAIVPDPSKVFRTFVHASLIKLPFFVGEEGRGIVGKPPFQVDFPGSGGGTGGGKKDAPGPGVPAGGLDEPRVRDIMRILCRIPIERSQLALYKLAVDDPTNGFSAEQGRATIGYDSSQFAGTMAALTVRINKTRKETDDQYQDKSGQNLVFDMENKGGQWWYRAAPELLAAIDRLPKLTKLMEQPISEVLKTDHIRLALPVGFPTIVGPGPRPPRSIPYFDLLDDIDAEGLIYPPDLVSNLLLALQAKRFVVLTGISGTGKTKIAQVLAKRFAVHRKVAEAKDLGNQAVLLTVMPYMVKFNRMVLPAVLAAQLPGIQESQGSGTLKARWPGGTVNLSIWRQTALVVLFRGALGRWFQDNLAEGDQFIARLEGPEGEPPDTLVLELATEVEEREVEVTNCEVVAVRPDWTDHRGLLGSYNPLTRKYLTTPFLRLLLRARLEIIKAEGDQREPAPFFLILDEMNLARVEHYFADFLSAMESGEPLHLHDVPELAEIETDGGDGMAIPMQIRVPKNLFFLGTVNVDESTYMFSPKVLDRAFTIELNEVDLEGLAGAIERDGELLLDQWNGLLPPAAKPAKDDWAWLHALDDDTYSEQVVGIHTILARSNRHFGYRVATEVARFVRLAVEQSSSEERTWVALDVAVLQKVLVKLHGTRQELGSLLDDLLLIALYGVDHDADIQELAEWRPAPGAGIIEPVAEDADYEAFLPRSAAKLWRMRNKLKETGFTSWIE